MQNTGALVLVALVALAGLGLVFAPSTAGGVTAMTTPEYVGNAGCIAVYTEERELCRQLRWAPSQPGCVRQALSRYQACDFAAAEPRPPESGPTVPAQ